LAGGVATAERMLETVTHARLRAEQGDFRGAREILLEILVRQPGHIEAQGLLDSFSGAPAPTSADSPAPEPVGVPISVVQRRIQRLERWLSTLQCD
jgi:hypothetical protein